MVLVVSKTRAKIPGVQIFELVVVVVVVVREVMILVWSWGLDALCGGVWVRIRSEV